MKDDLVYLKHILDSIENIEKYLDNISLDDFVKNDMIISATIRKLEIIGEAANNISEEFKINILTFLGAK